MEYRVNTSYGKVLKLFLKGKMNNPFLTPSLFLPLVESWKTRKDNMLCRIEFCHLAFLKQFRQVVTILNKLEIFYLNTKLCSTYLNKFFYEFVLHNNIKFWGFWPFRYMFMTKFGHPNFFRTWSKCSSFC